MKKNMKILLVALLLSSLAINSGNAVLAQTAVTNQIGAEKTEKSAEALIDDTEVIIRAVAVKDFYSSENDVIKPKAGNKFLAVQVVIDNTNGTKDWEFAPMYFKLKDSESQTYETSSFRLAQPQLNDDIVDCGDMVKGWITFEISKEINIKTLKLRFEFKGYTGKNPKSGWIFLSAVK